ncbi:hypothetical protein GCM10009792_20280 [Microcella alkalica]|uniref:Alkanesulfonate monooxygenase SsuD/methylene tetrahydromethanopterin reductase-like flavin-dependent oxidoreductase (Luciferase family) n=1 Tax=Microcella alkalica TaxID=355930 RepID=A0A839EDD5_9MICO|nr:LLM class flavin-dependent oxidoreductase [Microcella alkalica]MBA8847345.1 alkanesulfonate monooxygenase SsuD/methylene tetrahydromethanopterin reductase-like flavin-dependent oxidoreductase (luciferase family) [Microcella alkalica]
MRFGLGPLTMEIADPSKKQVDVYEEALEQTVTAEWWGFDSVWAGERHFTPDHFNSSASVIGAALAQRTEFVRVGVMPVLGLVNAMYLAEEVACIDNISNGRTIVAAQVPTEQEQYGWRGSGTIERMLDDIAVLRKSWGPNPFSHKSEFHTIPMENDVHIQARGIDKISVQPKPAQLEVPLWVSGSDVASQLAKEVGVPYFAPAHLPLSELHDLYADTQREGATVPLAREVFIARTTEHAHELAADAIAGLYKRMARAGLVKEWDSFEELARDRFIIGDAETCIEQLYRYQEQLGVNYVVARIAYHSMHHGETAKAVQLFGQAVVPEFRMFGLPDEIRKLA